RRGPDPRAHRVQPAAGRSAGRGSLSAVERGRRARRAATVRGRLSAVPADPPVVTVRTALLTDAASMQAFAAQAAPPAPAGAVVTFVGVVRDHDGGRGVRELEYEAHP